jgi:ferredoxin
MRTWVDLNLCEGCASCLVAAPEVFDLDDDTGKAVVLVEHPAPGQHAAVRTAVLHCPTQAVLVEDDRG